MRRLFLALTLIASTGALPVSGQQLSVDEKLDFIITELEALREAVDALSNNSTQSSSTFEDILGAVISSAVDEVSAGPVAQPKDTGTEAATSEFTLPIQLVGWTAQDYKSEFMFGNYVQLTIEFRNVSENEISIMDGRARFTDRLGKAIGSIKLDEDLNLVPGETYSQSGTYDGDSGFGSSGLSRLLSMNSNFVNVELDISQVLFSDGSIVSFD